MDRIHVASSDGCEWLFQRNLRDPRRVSGFLIEHRSRVIIIHEESDLRNTLGIRGWADVLTLGFDATTLKDFAPTNQTQSLGGIPFTRYTAVGKGVSKTEVWWNHDQALPRRFLATDASGGLTTFSIERVRRGAKAELLASPTIRFPTYEIVELADWLERH